MQLTFGEGMWATFVIGNLALQHASIESTGWQTNKLFPKNILHNLSLKFNSHPNLVIY